VSQQWRRGKPELKHGWPEKNLTGGQWSTGQSRFRVASQKDLDKMLNTRENEIYD